MRLRSIYYDTETTGLKPGKDRIIEIAAYDATNDKSFSTLVNPEMEIPEESQRISNITDEMVKDAPTFDIAAKKFLEFCKDDCVLIAHNNDSFDLPFLEYEFQRVNVEFKKFKCIDSLKWARKYRKDLPKHSLQYLREVYQIPANQAHRALDDVIVLHKVFSKMIDDLPIETVIDLLYKDDVPVMPFGKHQGTPLVDVPKKYIEWLNKQGAFDKLENKKLKDQLNQLGLLKAVTG